MGGLDTLEVIGRKAMDVIQEGDPGLRKKRAFLTNVKPNLSQACQYCCVLVLLDCIWFVDLITVQFIHILLFKLVMKIATLYHYCVNAKRYIRYLVVKIYLLPGAARSQTESRRGEGG